MDKILSIPTLLNLFFLYLPPTKQLSAISLIYPLFILTKKIIICNKKNAING